MIVGRSGSGKTTLLNLCAGLVKPTSGRVLVGGADLQQLDEKALSALRGDRIGFVFQMASMLPSLTVLENVAVPAMFGKKGKAEEYRGRALELLELVGIGDRKDALPKQLSGGEARRVAIARALMNKPDILIADEPTSDLDAQTELNIVATLQETHASGVTTIMVTHNVDLVPLATRALRMVEGRLLPY
jgi:putative ABC transport system ATP-binding protein